MAALTAALLATQAAGAISSYNNQKRDAGYAASVADQNATLADQQASDAIARGAEAEGRSRSQTKQILGAQTAGYAGQGVDTGTGSATDVAVDTAKLGALDAMTIRNNAAREAYGYNVEGANYRAQSANARQAGHNAWTTLLTGATQMAGTYLSSRSTATAPISDSDLDKGIAAVKKAKVSY